MSVLSRRSLFALAGGGALLRNSVLAAAAELVPKEKRRMLQMNGYAIDAETPLDALTTYITPNDLFFVRHHWNPMYPDARRWTLVVDGEVETPLQLTMAELKRLPARRRRACCSAPATGAVSSVLRSPAFSGATGPSETPAGRAFV